MSRTHSAVSMDSDQGASAGAAAKTAQKKVKSGPHQLLQPECDEGSHLRVICTPSLCTLLPTATPEGAARAKEGRVCATKSTPRLRGGTAASAICPWCAQAAGAVHRVVALSA